MNHYIATVRREDALGLQHNVGVNARGGKDDRFLVYRKEKR